MHCVGQGYVRQSVRLKIHQQEKSADLHSWASPLRFMVYFQPLQSRGWSLALQIQTLDLSTVHLEFTDSGALIHMKQTDERIIYQLECYFMSMEQLHPSHNNRHLPLCSI